MNLVLFISNKPDNLGKSLDYNPIYLYVTDSKRKYRENLKNGLVEVSGVKSIYSLLKTKPLADFAMTGGFLFVSNKGKLFLKEVIKISKVNFHSVEVVCEKNNKVLDQKLYLVNLYDRKRCINKKKSVKMDKLYRDDDLGSYKVLNTYRRVRSDLFWDSEFTNALLASDRFKDLYEKSNLSGLLFVNLNKVEMPMAYAAILARNYIVQKNKGIN